MKLKTVLIAVVALVVIVGVTGVYIVTRPPEKVKLVYITAGDINMLALGQNWFATEFTKRYPNVEVITAHTGPGDAGSRTIFEKLKAAKDAGKETWDVDVIMAHESFAGWAMPEGLLLNYAKELSSWKYITSPTAKKALGVDVEGYVMPMFHSQIAIAYNPKYVTTPPASYDELVEWVKKNPGKFGHNGIKGGMSGVGFCIGWVIWKTGAREKYCVTGPYDAKEADKWVPYWKDLKEFNKYCTITAGNVGTLDALNRGEIWMGPVWIDMFFNFMAEGKMDPSIKVYILKPGLMGQPMHFMIPKKAPNPEWAKKFIDMAMSPEIQAKIIVEKFFWYPGIDGKHVMPHVSKAALDKLFKDITPEDLAKYGYTFPLAPYLADMQKEYEKHVMG